MKPISNYYSHRNSRAYWQKTGTVDLQKLWSEVVGYYSVRILNTNKLFSCLAFVIAFFAEKLKFPFLLFWRVLKQYWAKQLQNYLKGFIIPNLIFLAPHNHIRSVEHQVNKKIVWRTMILNPLGLLLYETGLLGTVCRSSSSEAEPNL